MTDHPALLTSYRGVEDQVLVFGETLGHDWLFDAIRSGMTLMELAEQLECTRGALLRYLRRHPTRQQRWQDAERDGAGALVEQALRIVDASEGVESSAAVNAARNRAEIRFRIAAFRDRDTYGSTKAGHPLTVNIGELHLEALRALGKPPSREIVIQEEGGPAETALHELPAEEHDGQDDADIPDEAAHRPQ